MMCGRFDDEPPTITEPATEMTSCYGVIYCVTCKPNGKRYIGQTVQPLRKRWADHQRSSCCRALHRAIRLHGADAFTIKEVARASSKEELDALEVHYINVWQTTDRSKGYNLREGGSFGKHTDESRQAMSDRVRAAYASTDLKEKRRLQKLGSTLTEQQRDALRLANLGKKAADKTRSRLSDLRREIWQAPEKRQRYSEGFSRRSDNEQWRAEVSQRSLAQWSDPEKRQRLVEAQSAGKRAAWADPEKRAARLKKTAETLARKRAMSAA